MTRMEKAREEGLKKLADVLANVRERAEFPLPLDEAERVAAAKAREQLEGRYP